MSVHPNEIDKKRIERAIQKRRRYRYVSPRVDEAVNGYLIHSACCSRNIDPEGGEIDIARLEYRSERRVWWLYYKNHDIGRWVVSGEFQSLIRALDVLNEDPERRFWQ